MRRWAVVALAATMGLVPLAGALAHSHEHQHAAEQHAHGAGLPGGPTIAGGHDGEHHRHDPLSRATLSRNGGDGWTLTVEVLRPAVETHPGRRRAPASATTDPPPRSKHPPPQSPRAPPLG